MARKRIGELLIERGLVTPAQVEEGLAHHRQTRQRLGVSLIQKGFLTEEQLVNALSEALGIAQVDLQAVQPEWTAIHMLRARFCEQHDLFPYALGLPTPGGPRKQLLVAMSDPLNVSAIEEIEFTTGLRVSPRLAPLSAVRGAILRYYHKVAPGPADGTITVTHSKSGGGTVTLSPHDTPTGPGATLSATAPGAATEEEPVLEGEIVEGEPAPKGGDLFDDLFAAAAAPKGKPAKKPATPVDELSKDLDYLFGVRDERDTIEQLERKFWVLMKLMSDKGLITREEFARALEDHADEDA